MGGEEYLRQVENGDKPFGEGERTPLLVTSALKTNRSYLHFV